MKQTTRDLPIYSIMNWMHHKPWFIMLMWRTLFITNLRHKSWLVIFLISAHH
jgi:hypothetical protein